MAIQFVIEDGTVVAGATSYMSIAEMQQFWDNNGYDYSALTDDEIEVLLNKSTKIIDNQYLSQWTGYRSDEDQDLQWPRYSAYYLDPPQYSIDEDIIPQELKNGLAEMAYAINEGATLQPVITAPGIVEETYVRVDVIQERKKYSSTFLNPRDSLYAVEDALARLTGGSTGDFDIDIIRV